jgi:uncharacterized protein (DUF1501 family)
MLTPLTRRSALLGLTTAVAMGRSSLALAAPVTEKRFVVVLLRGALDGLSAVPAYGDPAFAEVRGSLALRPPGQPGGALDLGGFYGLHPSLPQLHAMYAGGEALVLHAAAGHYRSRSHFEAQDYLESGSEERLSSGWLNRAVGLMPRHRGSDLGLVMGLSSPLLMRGPTSVQEWAPDGYGPLDDTLLARLVSLSARDKVIGPALAEAVRQRGAVQAAFGGVPPDRKRTHSFSMLAEIAGRLLAQPDGPRIAALEIGGWDTHAQQARRLQDLLAQLDSGLAALKTGLGPAWANTAVLVVTEFGRTAHINGTYGTDHGTAGAAFLLGGAVAGGRVLADWPGLGAGKLFENRDLAPTTDVRSVIKGVLVGHLGLPASRMGTVLPGSGGVSPMAGLIRA